MKENKKGNGFSFPSSASRSFVLFSSPKQPTTKKGREILDRKKGTWEGKSLSQLRGGKKYPAE
jgi:hypothetical protein